MLKVSRAASHCEHPAMLTHCMTKVSIIQILTGAEVNTEELCPEVV